MKQQHKKYLVKRSGVLTGGWLLVAFTWTSAVYSLASIPCSCIVIKMIDYWLLWVVWALAVGQLASCLTLDYFGVQMSSRSTQWLQCPVSAKQARLITPAPQRYSLTWVIYDEASLSPNTTLCIMAKCLHFGLLFHKSLLLLKCDFETYAVLPCSL